MYSVKNSDIVANNSLCLRNISKEATADVINDTSLYGHIYAFSVDYRPVTINYVLDIHKYLMEKNNIR